MKQLWSTVELNARWLISEKESSLLKGKTGIGQAVFCVLLKYYQLHASFPHQLNNIPENIWEFVGSQIGITLKVPSDFTSNSTERMRRRYQREIRQYLNIRTFDQDGKKAFCVWANQHLFSGSLDPQKNEADIQAWFSKNRFEIPSRAVLSRLVSASERQFEALLFKRITSCLDSKQQNSLDALLEVTEGVSGFSQLRADPGAASLENVIKTIDRLQLLRTIDLSTNILDDLSPALIERYRLRCVSEDVWALKRHPEEIRWSLLYLYCRPREAEIIDGLVDLLISVTHKITARAEHRVITELVGELTKVHGKTNLLFRIAEAADEYPDGTVRDVIFPVAGEHTIAELVKEYRADGSSYVKRIYRRIRSSYAQHYRRMLPLILNTLEFGSNNNHWKPLLTAINLLKQEKDAGVHYYVLKDIPVEGVIRQKWKDIVIEDGPTGEKRVNRINYEICVLQSLREKLRTKEIWVNGAKRFCNPEQDLPKNFDENREQYYSALSQPLSSSTFTGNLKEKLHYALTALDTTLPSNPKVRIKNIAGKSRISVTPLSPQLDPPNLNALKQELARRWPATSLLDILKETDFRVGFTNAFKTSASRSALETDEVSRRLLLSLYGLGTNAGLKALAAGPSNVSYKELLNIRHRYIHKDSLRQAIRLVVNATLQSRSQDVWGTGTTSCASDSTKFAAWDQNLMTEWHQRYGGRGVMIYWHVDTQSTCIHSQLKRCSSSEVASMIEGVLHHCTQMEVDRQYVDTHGQSIIAFAFCYLLGFELMPRFKGISKQKLVRPDPKHMCNYPNIESIFAQSSTKWEIIEQQYDEMIKLATALLMRTAEPEAILRRFARSQAQHPVYSALLELGKAAKTLFLCKYLKSVDLRQEIHSGLNVVERWNGVNNFIYFGKGGEFSSNRLEEQEVSALSLHLLQSSMVYVNTLMIQDILKDVNWRTQMTERDMAALSPLPHAHLNPYGQFNLDMTQRIPLETGKLAI